MNFSLRTLILVTTGIACILGVALAPGINPTLARLVLVLAFAIPGGSVGYDRRKTLDAAALGTIVAAIGGSVLMSGFVIAVDVLTLFQSGLPMLQ